MRSWLDDEGSTDAKTTGGRTGKRARVVAAQTNANRANDAPANIDVCVGKHAPADVTRAGPDAFSNTFEHGDTYERGQGGYGVGGRGSLSNSLRGQGWGGIREEGSDSRLCSWL